MMKNKYTIKKTLLLITIISLLINLISTPTKPSPTMTSPITQQTPPILTLHQLMIIQ